MMALEHEAIRSPVNVGSLEDADLDDANIDVELEQGRSSGAGKLQYALLKQSAPMVHCSYMG